MTLSIGTELGTKTGILNQRSQCKRVWNVFEYCVLVLTISNNFDGGQ